MKKLVLLIVLLSLSITWSFSQGIHIGDGSHLVMSGNAALVINDGGFTNNGSFNYGGGTIYIKGSAPSSQSRIGGNKITDLNNLVIDKSSNGIIADTIFNFWGNLQMTSGDLDLNGQDLFLYPGGQIVDETATNRIWGNSGSIGVWTPLNNPNDANPGNLGVHFTSTDNLNVVKIKRIHGSTTVNGSPSMTRRYEMIYPFPNLNVDYTFEYFDSELNGNTEAYLEPWKYQGSWQQTEASARDATANTISVTGTDSGSDTLWAFSNGQLLVTPKVFLEGNFSAGLMGDNLRAASLIPTTEPYTGLGYAMVNSGGESVNSSVFTPTGNNAIVDWIHLQVRDPLDSTNVIQTVNALLQRDGDIVGLDGVSPVKVPNLGVDNYYLAIYHRNHLPIRSATKLALIPVNSTYDYSSALAQAWANGAISSNDAMKDLGSGVYGMIGGNVNGNTNVRATGPPFINDFSNLLSTLGSSTNILTNQYSRADLNMDGTIRATGPPFINDFSELLSILGTSTTIINAHID